jgi:hypothetical protein
MTYRFATFLLLLMVIALLVAGAWPAEVTPDTPPFPDLSTCDGYVLDAQSHLLLTSAIVEYQIPLEDPYFIARAIRSANTTSAWAQVCYHGRMEEVYRQMGWPVVVEPGASDPLVPPLYKGPEVQARLEVRP